MAKSSLERVIEKQQREAKKMAEDEARRQRASAIISGQPIIGGIRIMDSTAEELFSIILQRYDGNENRVVRGNLSDLPKSIVSSVLLEFEKLSMYGVVVSPRVWLDGVWEMYLTPQGLIYFENKETVSKKGNTEQSKEIQKQYDVFISHASRDKSDYVESLYMTLRRLGINIFYDTESISWGDNWKQAILNGTSVSEFAIIVISENFFGREWTERELYEFLQRQNERGQKIVLPLLHNITRDQLKEHYPELYEIQVINTYGKSKEDITILFAKELIQRLRDNNNL